MALLRLRTLAAQVYVAESDIVLSLPVGMPEEHCIADNHDEEWYPESWQVVDPKTNGMYASATHRRHTSFTVEGAKYLAIESPHRVMVIISTPSSNVSSRIAGGKPFLSMEVWESWGDDHSKSGRRGMDTTPGGLDSCVRKGTVAEVFSYLKDGFDSMTRLEDVFIHAGIDMYTFFVCGYHIHGTCALPYQGKFCALDWYSQSASNRRINKGTYEHWLILDQVCPTNFWKSQVFQSMPPFDGWEEYDIGS